MNKEKLYNFMRANPNHIKMLYTFYGKHQLDSEVFNSILESKYENDENEVDRYLFLTVNSEIKDICHLHGVKDMKSCTLTLPKFENTPKKRKIISLITEYALNALNMEEVFVSIDKDDQSNQDYLEQEGYECLGNEQNSIIFLKEKTQRDSKGNIRNI